MGLEDADARQLLARYARDYRRLIIDMKHEYESKMLLLRQGLENQALELGTTRGESVSFPSNIEEQPPIASSLLSPPSPAIIEVCGSISAIEKSVMGDISYTLLDRELIDLFSKYETNLNAIQLRSDLEQLKDISTTSENRIVSQQNVAGFLYRMMPKLGPSVVAEYVRYLKSLTEGAGP